MMFQVRVVTLHNTLLDAGQTILPLKEKLVVVFVFKYITYLFLM